MLHAQKSHSNFHTRCEIGPNSFHVLKHDLDRGGYMSICDARIASFQISPSIGQSGDKHLKLSALRRAEWGAEPIKALIPPHARGWPSIPDFPADGVAQP